LEEELTGIYKEEEIYWHRRGGVKWLLEVDVNTVFSYSVANGRRRKCKIEFLDTDKGRVTEQGELVQHIYDFYKKLFGSEGRGRARLAADIWEEKGKLSQEQREWLVRPFTIQEVEYALREMKIEIASGPDGFPVIFYKKF
jgi:hypothetical protein